jgi:hypothetical protein
MELTRGRQQMSSHLNNPESETFQNILENQIIFINQRFRSITSDYLNDSVGLCGEKEEIAKHLNKGLAQNFIQKFFKDTNDTREIIGQYYTTNRCIYCERQVGEHNIRQIDRAHCNNYSRGDLLMLAIDDLWVDNITPIRTGNILKKFIEKHELCPIYMLCKPCHNTYGR